MDEMTALKNRVQYLESIIRQLVFSDRYIIQRDIQLLPGRDLQLPTTTGTKIGTSSSQMLGFYGATPVDRPDTVSDPSGGSTQDAEARTAIATLIDRLQELGLIA